MNPARALKYRLWRRLHPAQRIGILASTSSRSGLQTAVGLSLIALGTYLRRESKQALLYSTRVDHGETVRIRVFRGDSLLGDTTIEG